MINLGDLLMALRLRDDVSPGLAVASRNIAQFGAGLESSGSTMARAGLAATVLTAGIALVGVASVKAAVDFETSFAGVVKTVDGVVDAENKLTAVGLELRQGFRDMAQEIPVNVNELNRIGEAAGQLGIKSETILGFTRVMADLGVSTNLSSDQAATSLARLANITQMPQTEFARLGATVVDLGNHFATTESEIVDFGLRMAGAGTQAGLSEANILAIGTAMSSVGVEAEAGGTAVQKVLLQMVQATVQGGETLELLGRAARMSGAEFKQAFEEDAAGAFIAFVEGLGAQGKGAIATLDALDLQDQRLIRSFLTLSGAGDTLREAVARGTVAWAENTALVTEAERRYGTTAGQLQLFWNRVTDLRIELGEALVPVMLRLVDVAEGLLPVVRGAVDLFATLPDGVQATVIVFLALAVALGPVLYLLGNVTMAVGTLLKLTPVAGVGLTTLAGGSGALATALGIVRTSVIGLTTALGPLAIAAAAVFAAWKIGHIQAVSDKFEYLGMRLSGVSAEAATLAIESRRQAAAHEAAWRAAEASVPALEQTATATAALSEEIAAAGAEALEAGRVNIPALSQALVAAQAPLEAFGFGIVTTAERLQRFAEAQRQAMSGPASLPVLPSQLLAATESFAGLAAVLPTVQGSLTGVMETVSATSLSVGQTLVGALRQAKAAAMDFGRSFFSVNTIMATAMTAAFGPGGLVTGLLQAGMEKMAELAWSGLKQIGGFFKSLFGGAGAEELAGRDIVSAFERNLAEMLTGAQQMEAGNAAWKQTTIVVRDAYLALGLSGQQALDDVKALWESSKHGAAASEEAVRRIQERMRGFGDEASAAASAVAGAFAAIPTEFDVVFNGSVNIPDDFPVGPPEPAPGFAGGTGGRFLDFGAGTTAVLHGRERVVTEAEGQREAGAIDARLARMEQFYQHEFSRELENAFSAALTKTRRR
jgi:TP901 family phage tail tape measure protein